MEHDSNAEVLAIVTGRLAGVTGVGAVARKMSGLSQAELAAAIGVSQSTLSRWEHGKGRMRADAAKRYAELLTELSPVVNALSIPSVAE